MVLSGLPSQPRTGRGLQTKILELKMLLHRSIIYRHVQVDAQHDFLLSRSATELERSLRLAKTLKTTPSAEGPAASYRTQSSDTEQQGS